MQRFSNLNGYQKRDRETEKTFWLITSPGTLNSQKHCGVRGARPGFRSFSFGPFFKCTQNTNEWPILQQLYLLPKKQTKPTHDTN